MTIFTCIEKKRWDFYRNESVCATSEIEECGKISCMDIFTFKDNYEYYHEKLEKNEELLIICINTKELHSSVKRERRGKTTFKVIQGLINKTAVSEVIPMNKESLKEDILKSIKKYKYDLPFVKTIVFAALMLAFMFLGIFLPTTTGNLKIFFITFSVAFGVVFVYFLVNLVNNFYRNTRIKDEF